MLNVVIENSGDAAVLRCTGRIIVGEEAWTLFDTVISLELDVRRRKAFSSANTTLDIFPSVAPLQTTRARSARKTCARVRLFTTQVAKARTAYQDFFALWKDADPDIPSEGQGGVREAALSRVFDERPAGALDSASEPLRGTCVLDEANDFIDVVNRQSARLLSRRASVSPFPPTG